MRNILLVFICILIQSNGIAQNADINLLRKINSEENKRPDNFWKFSTNTAAPICIASPIILLSTGYIKKDSLLIRNGWKSAIAFGLNITLTSTLKWSIKRDRPYVTYLDIFKKTETGPFSFPSGHTSSAFATATLLTLSTKKWYVAAPSFLWAGTVAYSRLYLGVHYPSDVFGGIIIGVGSGLLVWGIDRLMQR